LYESGDARGAEEKLRPACDQLAAQLGAKNPQSQVAAFWLVAAEIELGRVDEATRGLDALDAAALEAGAADGLWKFRLDALRGLALARRGDRAAAQSQLRTALAGFGDAKDTLRDRAERALAAAGA
jgi:non-specific serine/threonine protein kinase